MDVEYEQVEMEPCVTTGYKFKDDLKERDVKAAEALQPDELKKLVGDMCRYALMKGSKGEPIVRAKLADDVLGEYKKSRALPYVLAEAQKLLNNVWGYELVPAPCDRAEYAGVNAFKGAFYLQLARARACLARAPRAAAAPDAPERQALLGDRPG